MVGGKPNKLMVFNLRDYERALERAASHIVKSIADKIVERALTNLSVIKFHDYPVTMAGDNVRKVGRLRRMTGSGYVTDASRKAALIGSIVSEEIKSQSNVRKAYMVRTMANNFKDSHIGIYYETGTGEYWDGSVFRTNIQPERNPVRSGRKIVTRPAGSTWRDLGGNVRSGGAGTGGKPLDGFQVRSYRWFRRAVQPELINIDMQQIWAGIANRVNPLNYLKIKSNFTLGRD